MSEHRRHWALDPSVVYLNHGSFGACPRAVLHVQAGLRERMEREPVSFFLRDYERLLDEARAALARFVGARPTDLVFVTNATAGVNAVLRSLELRSGDELLVTDHAYNACRNALDFVACRAGARVVVAPIDFPLPADAAAAREHVVAAVTSRAGPATRLALLDHVTSPSGVVMPVRELAAALAGRGVDVLVDGAHAPGMIPLDLSSLGATYYTANCHKWLCAPKGAGFLWVHPDRQDAVRPLAISHGANSPRTDRSRLLLEFDWPGTDDPTAWLSVPAALEFMGGLLPGGWDALMAHNRALALGARSVLAAALGVEPPVPDAMIGSLASLPLPAGATPTAPLAIDPLQARLFERHRIEVPVMPWPPPSGRTLRISAQIYNDPRDYQTLAAALRELLDEEDRDARRRHEDALRRR